MATTHVETLAIDGGTPVRTAGWPAWPDNTPERWEAQVGPALREVYLSRTEGIPQPRARQLETRFAAWCGASHAVLTSHGTDALQSAVAGALDADSFGCPGEVICPEYTFIASATAPLSLQAAVCFVDCARDTFNLDPAAVEAAITPRTVGIMAVHLGGLPADLAALRAICDKHHLALIEDCAQAHGARHVDGMVGSLGDVAGFSFQSSKNLTSGEGGMVTTSNQDIFNRAYAYLNIGRFPAGERWEHPRLGWNYRGNEYAAALLDCRMDALETETDQRDRLGLYLNSLLDQIDGITPPQRPDYVARHAYHLYMMHYDPAAFGGHSRDAFMAALRAEGVACSQGYAILLSEQDGVKMIRERHPELIRAEPAPNTRWILDHAVWLTHNMLLTDRAAMDDIATAIAKIQRAWTA